MSFLEGFPVLLFVVVLQENEICLLQRHPYRPVANIAGSPVANRFSTRNCHCLCGKVSGKIRNLAIQVGDFPLLGLRGIDFTTTGNMSLFASGLKQIEAKGYQWTPKFGAFAPGPLFRSRHAKGDPLIFAASSVICLERASLWNTHVHMAGGESVALIVAQRNVQVRPL